MATGHRDLPGAAWLQQVCKLAATASHDFDCDGHSDIAWRHSGGTAAAWLLWRDGNTSTVAIWLMNGVQVLQAGSLGAVPSSWSIAVTGDFTPGIGVGKSAILWRDANTGTVAIWYMNGLQVSSVANVATVGTDWTIQGLNADG